MPFTTLFAANLCIPRVTDTKHATNLSPSEKYADIIQEIRNRVGGSHVIVFAGFSALSYKYPDKVQKMIRREIERAIKKYGHDHVVASVGVTSSGIGRLVYKTALELGIPRMGIVSSVARNAENESDIDPDCEYPIYIDVDSPKSSWSVEIPEGLPWRSFTLAPILLTQPDPVSGSEFNGQMVLIGGGLTTLSEFREALEERNILCTVYTGERFGPDPEKVAERKNTSTSATPVDDYIRSLQPEEYKNLTVVESF